MSACQEDINTPKILLAGPEIAVTTLHFYHPETKTLIRLLCVLSVKHDR